MCVSSYMTTILTERRKEPRKEEKMEDEKRRAQGKPPKRRKLNRAVAGFLYDRYEIERILSTPFKQCNRREVAVHKLMQKFHDNPKLLKARDTRALTADEEKELEELAATVRT